MTARYVGTRDRNWGMEKLRAVELGYSEKEETAFLKVCRLMEVKGWKIDSGVYGWGLCYVEDREEADAFISDWKESKKSVSLWMRFGF